MAVCQQSSTMLSPIFSPTLCYRMARGLADPLNNVLPRKHLQSHEPRLYVPSRDSTVRSITPRAHAVRTPWAALMPYSTCVSFFVASLKASPGTQVCKRVAAIAKPSSGFLPSHLFKACPCRISARVAQSPHSYPTRSERFESPTHCKPRKPRDKYSDPKRLL
jgi:hypothetical protein